MQKLGAAASSAPVAPLSNEKEKAAEEEECALEEYSQCANDADEGRPAEEVGVEHEAVTQEGGQKAAQFGEHASEVELALQEKPTLKEMEVGSAHGNREDTEDAVPNTTHPCTEADADEQAEQRINVGDRVRMLREDSSQCNNASIMTFNAGGACIVVFDDMLWAAYHSSYLEELLRQGSLCKLKGEEDVPCDERACTFLAPINGAPPDCFMFGELELPKEAHGWRWFSKIVPAPEDGTMNQRYSAPRISTVLSTGATISLTGRLCKLQPQKRAETKEHISTETHFLLLGFVQASLPSQKKNWAIVHSVPDDGSTGQTYISNIFGKRAEECHITVVCGAESSSSDRESMECNRREAMVSAHHQRVASV